MCENNIVQPEECDFLVNSLRKYQVEEIGTKQWLEQHEILLRLNQQAILEATTFREEAVKELMVLHGKVDVLVHEAFCVLVWRIKVLPKLLEIDPNPRATFMLYAVLFDEAIAIAMLETVLFHENGCAALGESALDLVDYCAQSIAQLIGLVNSGYNQHAQLTRELAEETTNQELERQKKDLFYKIGMRCLTILSYVADKLPSLTINVGRRMVQTHDMPCLLSEILHCQPWRRNVKGVEKYVDEKWQTVAGDDILKVTKIEAQTWFCLRQLLFNRDVMQHYAVTEFRQRELSKCQALLGVHLLDQLPPLAELKQLLCSLSLSGDKQQHTGILLEELPEIRDEIIRRAKRTGYQTIAQQQAGILLNLKHDRIVEVARRLNDVYNADFIARMEDSASVNSARNVCGNCSTEATKKCSKCERTFYCSRECQVNHWPLHKPVCNRD